MVEFRATHKRMLRILVPFDRFLRPDTGSGDRRFFGLLELMARKHRVDYVVPPLASGDGGEEGQPLLRRAGVNVLGSGWSTFAKALVRTQYHVAFIEFYWAFERYARTIRELQPHTILLTDSVDVHFARDNAGVKLGLIAETTAMETRTRELAAYRASDAVITVTPDDAHILRIEGGMPPLFVVPNVVPIRQRPSLPRTPEVLFVGAFHHPPNLDGIRWLVSDIWPRVRAEVPSAVLNVIGASAPPEVMAFSAIPGIQVLGYVPDTGPFLDRASVSIAPLRYGGGMKGKVNEALAAGVPLVSTSVGVQGFPLTAGLHAAVADRPEDFARAVVRLLKDPEAARAMGAAGQELARNYSPERIEQLLEAMLRELVPHPRSIGARLRWLASTTRFVLRRAMAKAARRAITL